MSESTGDRLFQIRLACGDGTRKAEPLDAFAERVKRVAGVEYDPSTFSLLERMKQKWKLDDVTTLAAVDPKNRGPLWLAFGSASSAQPPLPDPALDRKLTEQEIARAVRQAEAERAATTKSAPKKRRKRGRA